MSCFTWDIVHAREDRSFSEHICFLSPYNLFVVFVALGILFGTCGSVTGNCSQGPIYVLELISLIIIVAIIVSPIL